MIIERNMKFICQSGNIRRTPYDGLFKKSHNEYLITFMHGERDGSISLEINNCNIEVPEPKMIKRIINKELEVEIKDNDILYVTPCHPEVVQRRYGNEFENNNIKIYHNGHNDRTALCFYDGNKFPRITDFFPETETPFIIIRTGTEAKSQTMEELETLVLGSI